KGELGRQPGEVLGFARFARVWIVAGVLSDGSTVGGCDRSVDRQIGPCAKAKTGFSTKHPRGAGCPSPDDHEGADTEPDLAAGLHVESRRRFSKSCRSMPHLLPRHFARGKPGDAYNRNWHPSSHLFVFNYSKREGLADARERLPGDRNRVFDRWQAAEDP